MQVFHNIVRELMRPYRRWQRASQPPKRKRPVPRAAQPVRPARVDAPHYSHDFSQQEIEVIQAVSPYTMTSPERIWAVINAARHVVRAAVPGDIVECGVWRGGSSMAALLALQQLNDVERTIYLYDTFDGMPPPADIDCDFTGSSAADQMRAADRATSYIWALSGLDEVQHNLHSTGYPRERLRFVQGRVENTIPANTPERIALLRLDTDWYESTRHELVHLYPRLSPRGILIIDDYGHWQGARRATDEYFAALDNPPFLSRIDSTGRLAVKPA